MEGVGKTGLRLTLASGFGRDFHLPWNKGGCFHLAVPRVRPFLKYWLPVFIWMAVIFSASTDVLSSHRTSRILGPLLRWLKPDISPETIAGVQTAVRKTAHMAEYGVLACLFWRARRQPVKNDPRPWSWSEAAVAWLFAALYSASDEFHQSFVATRQASVLDALLDMSGALLGLLALWHWGRRFKKW